MMFALIYKGKVEQISNITFEVFQELKWVPISNGSNVSVGYLFDGTNFTPPDPPIPRKEIDDLFRRAVKRVIVAIAKYINGNITKAELGVIYNEVKDVLEKINE